MKLLSPKGFYKLSACAFSGLLAGCLFLSQALPVSAAQDIEARLEAQRAMPVQSNQIENWPAGPTVSAESAILMEAETGAILYSKNIHQKEFPASTTKILTCLIASEQCELDEMVTFSHDAVFDTPRDSNHIAIDEGEALTMEQCLNAILIRSANEVSFAVAEHISGSSWEDFAPMMNERAKELGCLNTNFVNPNGLPDENHYTTAYDLAMIGRAFFANELLCKMSTSLMLHIPPSDTQPQDIVESNSTKILKGKKYEYEYLVGCKTGYTNAARSCLVSAAEKDGMKLICVVMKDENPLQYEDTISLFNYGFSNFDKVNVSQTETKYDIDNSGFFYSDNDIFGNSSPILSLNKEDCIILPKTADFKDTVSTISYDTESEHQVAEITYTYHDAFIGSASVDLAAGKTSTYSFDTGLPPASEQPEAAQLSAEPEKPNFIFINIVKVLLWAVGIAAVIFFGFVARAFLKNYQFSKRNTRWNWLRNRKKRRSSYQSSSTSFAATRKIQIQEAKKRQRKNRRRFR